MKPNAENPVAGAGAYWIVCVAFLGWLFAGVHMSITQMTAQPVAIDLLNRVGQIDAAQLTMFNQRQIASPDLVPLSSTELQQLDSWKSQVASWFTWYQCAFLFGAAAGGFLFGWLGDRIGRAKAMTASILTYSSLSALSTLAQTPLQFWTIWFFACTGVGGMWPNGVAIVSEAWSALSRPALAGVIGTAANIGIFSMSTIGTQLAIASDRWRWVMLISALPALLGVVAWLTVPESPQWLAMRAARQRSPSTLEIRDRRSSDTLELFQPPLLGLTLIAILLGTVPMIGGWGTANWMNPWADETGNPLLKAQIGQARALAGIAGSMVGGWVAHRLGRRLTFFMISLGSLLVAETIFLWLKPTDRSFLPLVAILGLFNGLYFGWLPLCIPELFPTRVRATGSGIGFNSGRLITAVTLFISGQLMIYFDGDYARIGRATSWLFALGMIGACIAPDWRQAHETRED